MDSHGRREKLLEILQTSDRPVKGMELAKRLGVTRQIVVGDIALLRTGGEFIVSSTQGYQRQDPDKYKKKYMELDCVHTDFSETEMQKEFNAVVDNGGIIRGMALHHPIFGCLKLKFSLHSRREIVLYLERLRETRTPPVTSLTGGVHTLIVETADNGEYQAIVNELKQQHIFAEPKA